MPGQARPQGSLAGTTPSDAHFIAAARQGWPAAARRALAAEALLRRLVAAHDTQDWEGNISADVVWCDAVAELTGEARKLLEGP